MGFQEFCVKIFPRLRFKTLIVSSTSAFTSWLFISKDWRSFLSRKFFSLAKMQPIKLSVTNFLYSVVSDNPNFPAKLPSWCYMVRAITRFLVSPIYCPPRLQPDTHQGKFLLIFLFCRYIV